MKETLERLYEEYRTLWSDLSARHADKHPANLAGSLSFFALLQIRARMGTAVAKLALRQMESDLDFLDGVDCDACEDCDERDRCVASKGGRSN